MKLLYYVLILCCHNLSESYNRDYKIAELIKMTIDQINLKVFIQKESLQTNMFIPKIGIYSGCSKNDFPLSRVRADPS